MKSKLGLATVCTILILVLLNGIWSYFFPVGSRERYSFVYTITVVYIMLMLFVERNNLHVFGFDLFTLVVFVISCFLRMPFKVSSEIWFSITLTSLGLICVIFIIKNRFKVMKINFLWANIGFISGVLLGLLATKMQILSGYLSIYDYREVNLPFVFIFTNRILYALSFVTPIEEILVRGFLWGYLTQLGISKNKVFFVQALIFWLLHWNRISFPLIFFVGIPIITLLLSYLRLSSKQVSASLVAHTFTNAVSDSLLIFFAQNV